MVKVIDEKEFSNGEYDYRYSVNWEKDAYVDGENLGFVFEVKRRHRITRRAEWEKYEVKVTLESTEDGLKATLTGKDDVFDTDMKIAEFNLEAPFTEGEMVEALFEALPAVFFGGDMFAGCLIRSGLVSMVAQIYECRDMPSETYVEEGRWARAKEIIRCLRKNISNIGGRAIKTAGRCVVRAGF